MKLTTVSFIRGVSTIVVSVTSPDLLSTLPIPTLELIRFTWQGVDCKCVILLMHDARLKELLKESSLDKYIVW